MMFFGSYVWTLVVFMLSMPIEEILTVVTTRPPPPFNAGVGGAPEFRTGPASPDPFQHRSGRTSRYNCEDFFDWHCMLTFSE